MNWLKQVLTVAVLANWFACMVHCQAEQARLGRGSQERVASVVQVAAHAVEGDDCCVCDWVATGGCQAPDARVMAPALALAAVPVFAECLQVPRVSRRDDAPFVEWSSPPPEPSDSFVFFCRTALPVRGPSIAA